MPPRMVKRGAGSAGAKRTTRATRGAAKARNGAPDESLKAEVAVAGGKEELKVEEIQEKAIEEEEDPVELEEVKPVAAVDAKSDQNGFKSKFLFYFS